MSKFVACRYPGCQSLVDPVAPSGMCSRHMHKGGLCNCARCKRLRGVPVGANPAPAPKPQHPDRITVVVAMHVTTSAADNKAKVTLRRAPWQRGAAHG